MVVRVHDGHGITVGWLTRQTTGAIAWHHIPASGSPHAAGWCRVIEFALTLRPEGGVAAWHDLIVAVPHDEEPSEAAHPTSAPPAPTVGQFNGHD
jgi:hypothetical protein